jgi:predicted secreted protein
MINIIYIYPNTDFINNEINILRIIDEKIKESLVIFGIKKNNNLDIYITNTMTGDNKLVKIFYDINKFIEIIKSKEIEIKALEDLMEIEKYILNVIG